MEIGGIEKTSLIDWPGKIVCIIFTIGCNFSCPYCYNPELVKKEVKKIEENEILIFLSSHKGFIDGVILSGGEPTLQKDIVSFCKKIKKMGYDIGIETNGSNPKILKELVGRKLIDFIAMDVKTSLENYEKVVGKKNKEIVDRVLESIDFIKNVGIDYEFRITVVPNIIKKIDIKKICEVVNGAKKVVLQQFRNEKCLDKNYEEVKPYTNKKLETFKEILKKYVEEVIIRY